MKNSQHLKAYVQMHPDNKMAWYLLGKEYYKNGQQGKLTIASIRLEKYMKLSSIVRCLRKRYGNMRKGCFRQAASGTEGSKDSATLCLG